MLSCSSDLDLLSLSVSLNGLSEYSGHTAETKAMRLPSRDQIGSETPVLTVVSWRASPPSRSMIHSSGVPERVETKTTDLPSGDQRGWRSFLVVLVSWRRVLPSVDASQRLAEVLLAATSLTLPT